MLLLVAGAALALVPAIIKRPIRAIYVLTGAAVCLEIFPLGFPDSLTDTSGFFLNLNNTAGLPVSISPAEILMAVAILCWFAASRGRGGVHRPSGPILKAYLIYAACLVMAEVHGLISGGNYNITLWELRPQVYGLILFVLASSLIRERRQIVWIAGIFLAGALLKTVLGYYRYEFTLHGDLGGHETILAHEDSYFLLLYLAAAVAAAIYVRRRRVVLLLVAAAPLVAFVMLENRRRAAILALTAALGVVVVLAFWYERDVRKRVLFGSLVGAALLGAFVSANWNAQYGTAGQIVRPFHSITGDTNARDTSSDLYRQSEDADIKLTYAENPVIGIGFGLPMSDYFVLADISQQYPFWQYIPHNSFLWIAMRMGVVGMAAFIGLIGMVLLSAVRVLQTNEDRFLRGAATFAVAAIVAELLMGFGDLQLENYRNMIFTGIMIGLIDALPRLAIEPVKQAAAVVRWAPVPTPTRVPMGNVSLH